MIDKQIRSQIRQLMQTPQWNSLEVMLADYLKNYFLETSIKRENEFSTLWEASWREGGQYHLKNFFEKLEQEAQKQ